jgi:hypothetical protein
MRRILIKSIFLASILGAVGAQPALAYIDPNTGGMLFQILAVAFASLSAIVLIFSRQIRTLSAKARRAVRGLFGGETEATMADGNPSSDPGPPTGTSSELTE